MTPIPASEKNFRVYVKRSGFVDITRATTDDEDGSPCFTLSTEVKNSRYAFLYAKTRPEPRSFSSESAITQQLIKWGLKVAALPVVDGLSRCYLESSNLGLKQPATTTPIEAANRGRRLVASR
ncbi:hypothetical protein QCN27_15985 [Cereibacter sp. SYSU M97828]|nr:hypothetical protein [Cereibacter flavus]